MSEGEGEEGGKERGEGECGGDEKDEGGSERGVAVGRGDEKGDEGDERDERDEREEKSGGEESGEERKGGDEDDDGVADDADDEARPPPEQMDISVNSLSRGKKISRAAPIPAPMTLPLPSELSSALPTLSLEFVESKLAQPSGSQESCTRAGGPRASLSQAAAHANRPVNQAPPPLEDFERQRALSEREPIAPPPSGTTRPGASVANLKESV